MSHDSVAARRTAPSGQAAAAGLVARLREVHLQMLDAVLTGDGLAAVAELAAEAAGGPVAIVVPRLGAAHASAGGEPLLGAVRRYVGERCRDRPAPVPDGVTAEVPIASGDERIGGVVLLAPGRPEPEAVEFLHLAAVAALTEVAVEEAYRIRTGESGEETLQAHPEVAAQATA